MEALIKTLSVAEATEKLRTLGLQISPDTVRQGLQQKIFPFGDYIQSKTGNPIYFVYEKLFLEWIAKRLEEPA